MTDPVVPSYINPLPPAPEVTDSVPEFDSKAFPFVEALVDLTGEINATVAGTYQNALAAGERAGTSTTSAGVATTAKNDAVTAKNAAQAAQVAAEAARDDALTNTKGWSPMLRLENDGDRRVLFVYDWTGGAGTKPSTTGYIGSSGLTPNKSLAIDVRGKQGFPGVGGDLTQILAGFDASNQTPITDTDTLIGGIGKAQGQINKANSTLSKAVLSYPDYDTAVAAAATLPDGQVIIAPNGTGTPSKYLVNGGGLLFVKFVNDSPSVKDYGAVGDGSDATEAFSAAAAAAIGGNPGRYVRSSIPKCDFAIVRVPAGQYLLNSLVDTGGKEIVWDVDPGAVIRNPNYINGRVLRDGVKITDSHHGTEDTAVSFSVMSNRDIDEQSPISGWVQPGQMSQNNGRDSVGAYFGNRLPAATYFASSVASYNSNGVVLSTALTSDQLKLMRKGMFVYTRHSPSFAGLIDSWTANSITVKDGWFKVDGSPLGIPETPTGTNGLDVNGFRKAWALNANVFIDSGSFGHQINAFELGVRNSKGEPSMVPGASVDVTGMYVVNIGRGAGYYGGSRAYIAAGRWKTGYDVWGGCEVAYSYDGAILPDANLQNLIKAKNAQGRDFYTVTSIGSVEAGPRGSGTETPITYDFHSGAVSSDYDSRIISTGGDGTSGGGTLELISKNIGLIAREVAYINAGTLRLSASASVDFYSVLRPSVDGTIQFGQGGRRISEIFAVTGTINTSDGREKSEPLQIDDALLDAWGDVQFVCFQWLSAIAKKGVEARWHFGVIAQQVRDAFAARGIDGARYGLLCYDEWGATPAVFGEDGGILSEAQEAGNRWGIRADQCLFLEAAYQRRRADRIETRITALEGAIL